MPKQFDNPDSMYDFAVADAAKRGHAFTSMIVVRYEHGTAEPFDPVTHNEVKNASMRQCAELARRASVEAGGAAAYAVMGGDVSHQSGVIGVVVSPDWISRIGGNIDTAIGLAMQVVHKRLMELAEGQGKQGLSLVWLVPRDLDIKRMEQLLDVAWAGTLEPTNEGMH